MSETSLFIEASGFTRVIGDYFASDEDYASFQIALAEYPTRGDVIPGLAPLRKVRWASKGKGMGKRGGLRVIYLHLPEVSVLFLLDVYGKNEADDLSPSDKKELKALTSALVAELKAKYQR